MTTYQMLAPLLTQIKEHMAAYGIGGGVIVLAWVAHWPEKPPSSFQDWWTWVRQTLQTALPISRLSTSQTHVETGPLDKPTVVDQRVETIPTTPAEPAKPKE
jgi:hypothetical protein